MSANCETVSANKDNGVISTIESITDLIKNCERTVQGLGSDSEKEFYQKILHFIMNDFTNKKHILQGEYSEIDIIAIAHLAVLEEKTFKRMVLYMANCIFDEDISVETQAFMANGLAHILQLAMVRFPKRELIALNLYDNLSKWLLRYVECCNELCAYTVNPTNARLFLEGLVNYLEALPSHGFEKVSREDVCYSLQAGILKKFKDYPDPDIAYLVSYIEQGVRRLPTEVSSKEQFRQKFGHILKASRSLAFIAGAVAAAAVTGGAGFIPLLATPEHVLIIYENLSSLSREHEFKRKSKWYDRAKLKKVGWYDKAQLEYLRVEDAAPIAKGEKFCLDKDFTASMLNHMQRDIILHIAQGRCKSDSENSYFEENMHYSCRVLMNIAYQCTHIDADVWLFAKSVWLLCQLKMTGKLGIKIKEKMGFLEKDIKRELRANGLAREHSSEKNAILILTETLLFLLDDTGDLSEDSVKEKLSNIADVFLRRSLGQEIRQNALKALFFLCKYEDNRYGILVRKMLEDLLCSNPVLHDKVGAKLIRKWLPVIENAPAYVAPKPVDHYKFLDRAQMRVQHQYAPQQPNLPSHHSVRHTISRNDTTPLPGWFNWLTHFLFGQKQRQLKLSSQ